ncbi:MAG: hypothetical protein MZV63_03545, partial [Marinilabiliales bacterium]|nr:hypothetical protein [Marinilabiliales bacterium]
YAVQLRIAKVNTEEHDNSSAPQFDCYGIRRNNICKKEEQLTLSGCSRAYYGIIGSGFHD